MFGFGTIKTATVLGGAILRVRELQRAWPRALRGAYARRIVKCAGLRLLGSPAIFGAFAGCAARCASITTGSCTEANRVTLAEAGPIRHLCDPSAYRSPVNDAALNGRCPADGVDSAP